jgi:putative oxidoreductase
MRTIPRIFPTGGAMNPTHQDLGKLVLRVTIGLLMLLHGIAKLRTGVDPIAGMLAAKGLPGVLAYGAYVGEVLAPILLIVGFQTRIAAILVAVNMVFAIGLAHAAQIFQLSEQSGGWAIELQGLYLFGAIAIALLGAGRYSLDKR